VRVREGVCVFFFQAEDGIRDWSVTGVQTCALPISVGKPLGIILANQPAGGVEGGAGLRLEGVKDRSAVAKALDVEQLVLRPVARSEERRVGKEGGGGGVGEH